MKKILTGLMAATLISTSALAESARDRAQTVVPKAWKDSYKEWHYAPAVKVDGRIYVSGVAVVPEHGDYAAAYRNAWHKIGEILRASGASLDDVVEIVSYHTNLKAQLPEFGRVKDEFIRAPYPAWTAVGVSELAMPGEVAEIRVVAHAGGIHDLTG
ncbi:RidA family protein [Kordiimonas marina]|uniref:RidA family protein n=1 Tax=Kordiimonas marina TaxID=2872312 RepID=UPI001FF6D968|nr:RidA family protein [Kordiimonas marina]MCJ9430559.1 RidA family protein [Kordiimonas marina]